MASLFSLSSMPFSYVTSAVKHKLQSAEQKARRSMQLSSASNLSIKENQKTDRIESIVECVESLMQSFLVSGYNTAIALLVTIPAMINKNSQPSFPNIKKFWKRRLCSAGISFGIGFTKILVLIKITGIIHLIGSITCYCKPSLQPTFQKINNMSTADIELATATLLSGIVMANIDQKTVIDKTSSFATLVLHCAKPIAVEMLNKAQRLIYSTPADQKDLERNYDKKCCEIIRYLDESNNIHEVKDHFFHLCKDASVQTIDTCNAKASIILRCVLQSIKNIFEENATAISSYYQTRFSSMKISLENAKTSDEITCAVKDFSVAIGEIFNGLKTAVIYEKNSFMKEIAYSLQTHEDENETEEFEDALEEQELFLKS